MAVTAKQRANLKPIKKGQVLNPNGARTHNPIKKALMKLTVETYREVIELVLTGNLAALEEVIKNPNTPAIQVGVATAFVKALKAGDYGTIERIAERIVGKIPEVINLTSNNTNVHANLGDDVVKKIMDKIESDV